MPNQIAAKNSKMYRDDGADGLTTPVANIVSYSFSESEATTVEVTDHDSTGVETIPGPTNPGTLTIEINWNETAASHALLLTDKAAGTAKDYQIHWATTASPAGSAWEFNATPTGFNPNADVNDALKATVTFTLAGAITYGATKWA